jgi:hypothetical protein
LFIFRHYIDYGCLNKLYTTPMMIIWHINFINNYRYRSVTSLLYFLLLSFFTCVVDKRI